jgi:hypothetical protein
MIRALATLLGFAAAAVLLAVAPDAGDLTGDHLWYIAGVWAAAGLVAGIFYQAGGVRRPGTRLNMPMLFLAWLPWTLLAAGAIVQIAEPGSDVARLYRDVLPDTWLAHWAIAMSALAFGSGLLLAFSLIEPRVAVNRIVTAAEDDRSSELDAERRRARELEAERDRERQAAMPPPSPQSEAETETDAPTTDVERRPAPSPTAGDRVIVDDSRTATDLDEQPMPATPTGSDGAAPAAATDPDAVVEREEAARVEGAREQAAVDRDRAARDEARMARSTNQE